AHLANRRNVVAHTKDRSEVRGGGAKPWKQKGTGRARHGSNRSPIWIGGGVTFGPSSARNFKQKINKKEKRKALLMTLSSKLSDKKLILVDEFKMEKISTKKFIKNISKLPVKDNKVLLVLDKKDDKIIKSIKNIPSAKSTNTGSLNLYDILKYDSLLMTVSAVENIEKNYKK
ncbi:MAG: 50S ribosomal protein L4, partial [Parcubacteria group bacterium]|nr:50S ribosomal protein L4 [Parcubacteria group bacterium]